MQIEQKFMEIETELIQSVKCVKGMSMRNVWKKFVGFSLTVCVLVSACAVGAAGGTETGGCNPEERGGIEIMPLENHLVINKGIDKYGVSWEQDKGYPSYRVWVENTTNRQMRVTISEPSGQKEIFYVPAGGNKTHTVNDAMSGFYRIDFVTSSGVLSGTVRVRVSETLL